MSSQPKSSIATSALPAAVAAACALAFGFAAGWLAGAASSPGAAGAPDSPSDAPKRLSARSLANIGVEVGEAALGEFVRTREVPAVAELPDAARAPSHAPVAGVVRRVLAVEGQCVEAGAPVAEIARDPFPRPALVLVDAVLRPLNEEHHAAIVELRTATQAHAIAAEELARVRAAMGEAGGEGAVPAKVERDLEYEERRTSRALDAAREELERHGLTREEIARAEAGEDVPLGVAAIRRVLERNLLWSRAAQAALDALPEPLRALPFTVAVLGELAGTRLIGDELAEALRARPALAASFLDVAGLLQQGFPVERLRALEALGALAPVVPVRAPDGAKDWDVERVLVKPGARVELGAAVAVCVDPRRIRLRLSPAGADLPALASAAAAGEPLRAEPLVSGAGPALEDLALLRLEGAEEAASHGSALATARNEPVAERVDEGGARFRSWALREGLRYLVHVPVERLPGRFVLPAGAVVFRGADALVFLEDGDSFRPEPVRVEHLDARHAVVANDGALFPGDRVATANAYALSLALQAHVGGAAGHGHGHAHD